MKATPGLLLIEASWREIRTVFSKG